MKPIRTALFASLLMLILAQVAHAIPIQILDIERKVSFVHIWNPEGSAVEIQSFSEVGLPLGNFNAGETSSINLPNSSWADVSQNTDIFLTSEFVKIRGTGNARARIRDFPASSSNATATIEAQSSLRVKFQLEKEEDYLLEGELLVKKGGWFESKPESAILNVEISLTDMDGIALHERRLTSANLINPDPSSPNFYIGSYKDVFSIEDALGPGVYEFSVVSSAFASMILGGEMPEIQLRDGDGIFDFVFAVAVPEPSTLSLFGIGLVCLGFAWRKRGA